MTELRPEVVAVGLTGGIGAGKSTALAIFAELGALTLSADTVVHELYTGEDCKKALVERFGVDVLDAEGEIDRRRLAALVRGRPDQLQWLERLTHPLVRERIEAFVKGAPAGSVVVCEVPLLFESGLADAFDLVVTIEASAATRRGRSTHGFDPGLFDEFEGLQASTERRVAGSNLAFFNDDRIEHLRMFVHEALARAKALLPEES
jgi:dephospho-CoA kinase